MQFIIRQIVRFLEQALLPLRCVLPARRAKSNPQGSTADYPNGDPYSMISKPDILAAGCVGSASDPAVDAMNQGHQPLEGRRAVILIKLNVQREKPHLRLMDKAELPTGTPAVALTRLPLGATSTDIWTEQLWRLSKLDQVLISLTAATGRRIPADQTWDATAIMSGHQSCRALCHPVSAFGCTVW